jgi:hypothetical protein
MSSEAVDHLFREIHDLLDVSSVGLYEFLAILNTPDQPLTLDERRAAAHRALRRLLQEPGVRLVRLRWPEFHPISQTSLDELPSDPWAPPDEDGFYLAVDRADA